MSVQPHSASLPVNVWKLSFYIPCPNLYSRSEIISWFMSMPQRPDCSRTWTPAWSRARTSISTHVEAGSSGTSFPKPAHSTACSISWETSWRSCSRVGYVSFTQTPWVLFLLNSFVLLVLIHYLTGVLEMESKDDREAFKKAKTLYSSCMNESEYTTLCNRRRTLCYIVSVMIYHYIPKNRNDFIYSYITHWIERVILH